MLGQYLPTPVDSTIPRSDISVGSIPSTSPNATPSTAETPTDSDSLTLAPYDGELIPEVFALFVAFQRQKLLACSYPEMPPDEEKLVMSMFWRILSPRERSIWDEFRAGIVLLRCRGNTIELDNAIKELILKFASPKYITTPSFERKSTRKRPNPGEGTRKRQRREREIRESYDYAAIPFPLPKHPALSQSDYATVPPPDYE